ncbi:TPA: transposase, partial [Escherichia coli]|nr:transposase [Escherichia coli]
IQQGIQQGVQQGALQKAREIARELRNAGMPTAQICQLTGLSEAELKNITH